MIERNKQTHTIVIQVGPDVDIKSHVKNPINSQLFQLEAQMTVQALVDNNLITPQGEYLVSVKNDNLGGKTPHYPVIEVDNKIYRFVLTNHN